MPLYVAQCPSCHHETDYVQPVKDHRKAPVCDCGVQMQQILTPVRGFADLPEYQSPVTGKMIRGRRARRDDLERNNCRPFEGVESEERATREYLAKKDREFDARLTETLSAGYESLSSESRQALETIKLDVTSERA